MTRQQNIALVCVIAVIAVVLVAVGGYFIGTYSSSDGERRSNGFVYSTSGNTAVITAYEGENETVTIPARIAGRRVALVEEGFLDNNTSVNEVIFSEDITMIELEEGIFKGNTRLESVKLPDALLEIPDSAFEDCTGLVSVKLPANLKKIGANAFEGCTDLETTGSIGEKQFVIPNSVTEVGEEAFKDCGDLTSVTIGTGLKDIAVRMFDNCDSITTLTFAEGSCVEQISEGAFRGNKLGKVTFPDSLKYIGVSAFEGNDNASFTTIVIPAEVVTVSNYAFKDCTHLKTVEFAAREEDGTRALKAIGTGVFMNCSALKKIGPADNTGNNKLPEEITTIPELAFYGCKHLESFEIGKQITSVGDGAFAGGVASEVTDSIDIKFLSEASGYRFVQLTSYTYFKTDANGSLVNKNRSHYILTDSTGEIVYAYIGAFDPAKCNNKPDLSEWDGANNNAFHFLMDYAYENDITELAPYALAGVKGRINIPSTVEKIGAYCFKDCEKDKDSTEGQVRIYIENSDCEIDTTAFDGTSAGRVLVITPIQGNALGAAIDAAIDEGNRNWLEIDEGSPVR